MTDFDYPVSRRGVLAGAGAVGAAVALTGCGSSETAADPPSRELVPASAVPVGGAVVAGDTVVVQPRAGVFEGFSAVCTHAGCAVKVASGGLECPCHQSKFRFDGSVVSGPAPRPLDGRAVRVAGGMVVRG